MHRPRFEKPHHDVEIGEVGRDRPNDVNVPEGVPPWDMTLIEMARTSHIALLGLLEHDYIHLTLCEYCRKLHKPFAKSRHRDTNNYHALRRRVDLFIPGHGHRPLTLQVVRATLTWDRRRRPKSLSPLRCLYSVSTAQKHGTIYIIAPRVRGQSCQRLILKQQLSITFPVDPDSTRSAFDVVVLDSLLSYVSEATGWAIPLSLHIVPYHFTNIIKDPDCWKVFQDGPWTPESYSTMHDDHLLPERRHGDAGHNTPAAPH
ncbi:hypothetical protein B0H63DRAFT_528652 [Podospora didyma]|uniref:Uncharacterized protein n=1 Tax=Podospora didyma TaxID=330526 RepID=A0AAE0K2P9_9PEZI|nr:hypothetical protein B0H63DRAFT_528652 [Podospora didyma]